MITDLLRNLTLSLPSLQPTLDAIPVAICCMSLEDQSLLCSNRAFAALMGYQNHDPGALHTWIATIVDEAERARVKESWRLLSQRAAEQQVQFEPIEIGIRRKDGSQITVLHGGTIQPQAGWALCTFIDMTERKQKELHLAQAERLARSNERLSHTLLSHSRELIILSAEGGSTRFVSPNVQQIIGWTPQEFEQRGIAELVHAEDLETVEQARRQALAGVSEQRLRFRLLHKSGGIRWMECVLVPHASPGGGYVATMRDIAFQKKQEDILATKNSYLARLAQVDELTGIANRRHFNLAFDRETRRKSRISQSIGLMLLDVDNFKNYNDLYGHLQGDVCLRQVAQTLQQTLHRVADLVARYGGEEFVILLPMTEPKGAERIASNVLAAVSALRIPHSGTPLGIVTISIGVSTWPARLALDQERLLEEADRALYRAKRQGRNTFGASHCSPGESSLAE